MNLEKLKADAERKFAALAAGGDGRREWRYMTDVERMRQRVYKPKPAPMVPPTVPSTTTSRFQQISDRVKAKRGKK